MKPHLFKPKKHRLSDHIIFIPQFLNSELLLQLKRDALFKRLWLGAELIDLGKFTIVCGFFGYPHLFAVAEAIDWIATQRISFLGTAGSLRATDKLARTLQIEEIHASGVLRVMTPRVLPMNVQLHAPFPLVKGVSVDIIQRETVKWLFMQQHKGIEIVEMEIFPLRWFLRRSIEALVVTTDVVTERGIISFADRRLVVSEFTRAFQWLIEGQNEKASIIK